MATTAADRAVDLAARLDRYRETGLSQVTGWFHPESAEVMAFLLLDQVRRGFTGNVAEIGVHHGRSFLLLANGTTSDETAVAVDVFEDQAGNLDSSGLGDRGRFEANVQQWAPQANVTTVSSSSLDITPATAAATFGTVRMFSIDGGHTAEVTEHDLRLAEAVVAPGAVVVLDDLLNAHWLGVMSGFAGYMGGDHALVPFALSENKLYLTTSASDAQRHREVLRAGIPDLLGKSDVPVFEHQIDVYGMGSPRRKTLAHAHAMASRRATEHEARLAARVDRLTRRSQRLARERDRLEARVDDLVSSRSWQVTAPVRRVSTLVRRVLP